MSLVILLPLVTGLFRFKRIPVSWRPIIYLLFIGLINELVSFIFLYNHSAIPNNIYCLFDFVFLFWQFRNWGNILRNEKLFYSLLILLCLIWLAENVLYQRIGMYSPIYRIAYSLTLILLAVNQMNWVIVNDTSNIYKNPVFIVCIAIIVFYAYKILMEIFYYYAPGEKMVQHNIFNLEAYVNIVFNILLAIAILCIPRKKDFTLQL